MFIIYYFRNNSFDLTAFIAFIIFILLIIFKRKSIFSDSIYLRNFFGLIIYLILFIIIRGCSILPN